MRLSIAFLLSSSTLVAPLAQAKADDVAWPQVGGWGQAWSNSVGTAATTPQSSSLPPVTPRPLALPESSGTTPRRVSAPAPKRGGAAPSSNRSADDDSDRPIKMTADEVSHDQELDIVTARGAVEAFQGRRHLQADTVTYNVRQGIVAAVGNVILVEPTGEVTKADYLELTNDFGAGIAKEIRYLAIDKSRVVATSATRSGGNRTDFDHATYTPCEPCKDHPEKTPLWQATARQVTHNQEEKTVEYRDVWLDVDGVPVLYSPYFSSPDPSVKRMSGFLTPTFGSNRTLGKNITIPYYYVLNPQEDITLYPRFMLSRFSKAPNVDTVDSEIFSRLNLGFEDRWTGYYGAVRNTGSFGVNPDDGKMRGMFTGKGIFDITTNWRAGYQISRMSDDTYSRIYGYAIPSDKPFLTSRVYSEGFWQKDYAVIESFGFQGITPTTDATTQSPWVMPHASLTHLSTPGKWDDYWTISSDTLTYTRQTGINASRVSNKVGWTLPYRDGLGSVWKVVTSAQTDAYHSDGNSTYGSSFTGRAIPLISVNWSYPFVNTSSSIPQTITPMGMIAASPNAGNPHRLPNEDSIDYELDDINIFQPNRTAGLDRVEEGVRGAYGVRWVGMTRHGDIQAQFAQGWRGHQDQAFNDITGYSGSLSDYLAQLTVEPANNLRISDRIRLDKDTLSAKRNEASIDIGPTALKGSVSYYYFEKTSPNAPTTFGTRQQIYYNVNSEISRYWSLSAGYQMDLETHGSPIGWQTKLTYNDECFALIGSVVRNFTYQNDYLGGLTVSANVVFKSFGQMPFTLFSD